MRACVFLDRDGTINREKDYLHRIEDFEFEDGCIEGLLLMRQKGYELVIISNQSGIARGYYGMEDALAVNRHMTQQLEQYGIDILGIYICPHGEDDGCGCRKPKPGLFIQAAEELDIDLFRSYAAGDRARDLIPAETLGCGCGLLLTGHGKEDAVKYPAYRTFKTLLEFAEFLPCAL